MNTSEVEVSKRKRRFHNAIRLSLEYLVASDMRITASEVIRCARYSDGSSVGKATLYSRHAVTNELVHAELIKEIAEAADLQKKRSNKPTFNESLTDLRLKLAEEKEENRRLLDQIVSQESRLLSVISDAQGEQHFRADLESQIYVLASITDRLSNGALSDVRTAIRLFEVKYAHDPRLQLASKEVARYLVDIKNHGVVAITGPNLTRV